MYVLLLLLVPERDQEPVRKLERERGPVLRQLCAFMSVLEQRVLELQLSDCLWQWRAACFEPSTMAQSF